MTHSPGFSAAEMMTVAAARMLRNEDVCFVGIGAPSEASNLARLTHAPDITLVYESGTIGTRPTTLPLSIGDPELCETSLTTVSVPEMFQYWLQGGRITVGFLGAAQIDRHCNINTTVIGDYDAPAVRLPGAGGAPEIASHCQETYVIVSHRPRTFVERLDFITSFGHGEGGNHRQRLGLTTQGPTRVITDLCLATPHPETKELEVVSLHEGVIRRDVEDATGWDIRFADELETTRPPTDQELDVLRDLKERTRRAHSGQP